MITGTTDDLYASKIDFYYNLVEWYYNHKYCFRRLRFVRRGTHRVAAREVPVRPRGILQNAISQPDDEVRETPAEAPIAEDGLVASDRTALLREAGGEDTDRNADQGHAAQRQQFQLALHESHVTQRLEAAGFRLAGQRSSSPYLIAPIISYHPLLRPKTMDRLCAPSSRPGVVRNICTFNERF